MFPFSSQLVSSRSRTAPRRWRPLEELESRITPTANLYVDFGDFFPAGGLQMTALQLRDTFGNGGVQGPDVRVTDNATTPLDETIDDTTGLTFRRTSTLVNFDYNNDGIVNNADYTDLRANVMSLIQRYYAPFDVNVILAPAVDNTSSATYITGVQTFLQAGANVDGERDCWVFVADIVRTSDLFSVGQLNSANGIAAGADIGGNNARDDSAVTFSDQILVGLGNIAQADTRLAYTTAHEAAHTFGLQHTWNGGREGIASVNTGAAGSASFVVPGNRVPDLVVGQQITIAGSTGNDGFYTIRAGSSYNAGTGRTTLNVNEAVADGTADGTITFNYTTDTALLNRSDLIVGSAGTVNRVNLDFFTRYPLATDDPFAGGGDRPTVVDYDRLADPNVLGLRAGAPAYITGTGAFDVITVTRVDGTTANVSVQPHRDNSFANPIGAPFAYQVNYTNGLLIEAGFADDRLILDVTLGVSVTFRGTGGSDDELVLSGDNAATGTFTPASSVSNGLDDNPDYRGVVFVSGGFGSTTVNIEEFSSDGLVFAQNLAAFTFLTPNPNDTLTISSPTADINQVDGTSGGVEMINFRFQGVNTFSLDATTNDALTGIDDISIDGSGFVASGLQNVSILMGPGDDILRNNTVSLTLPVGGGTLSASFGGGDDTLVDNTTRANLWSITGGGTGNLNSELAFDNLENLRAGLGNDTFAFAGGFLLGNIEGRDGNDTLIGDNNSRSFTLNAPDAGTVSDILFGSFSSVENLTGGSSNDQFQFLDGSSLTGNINGGDGNDTLIADNGGRTFNLGIVNSQLSIILGGFFSAIENLTGGTGDDTVNFNAGTSVVGNIDGGDGNDTLDYSPFLAPITTNLESLTSTAIGGTFANIENLIGSDQLTDLLIGANNFNFWFFDGPGAGDVDGFNFQAIENFTGGSQQDNFFFAPGGSILGDIDGNDGFDVLDFSNLDSVSLSLTALGAFGDFNGFTSGFLPIGDLFFNINAAVGSFFDSVDTIINETHDPARWDILGVNGGLFTHLPSNTPFNFFNFEFLEGGDLEDTFVLQPGSQITGSIDGNAGFDRLIGQGSAGADSMTLRPNNFTFNGLDTLFTELESIHMLGQAGPDRFTVRFDQGNPIPSAGLLVRGGAGVDVLNTIGSLAADTLRLTPSQLRVNGAAITYQTLERMDLYGGAGNDRFDARAITYQAALQLVRFHGQDGNDTITLAPSVTTRFFIHGGAPSRPNFPGDALFFVKNGQKILRPVLLGNGGSNGLYRFTNRRAVQFVSIERGAGGTLDIQPWNDPTPAIF